MNLTQERINEIALDLAADWIDESTPDDVIVHFANLFLSRIREEQEAVALAAIHPDGFLHSAMIIERNMDVVEAWEKANIKTVPLFTIPPSAPDCKELIADAERYRFLKDNIIEYKPAGHDGCIVSRYDAMWVSDTPNLDEAIDAALSKHKASMGEKE